MRCTVSLSSMLYSVLMKVGLFIMLKRKIIALTSMLLIVLLVFSACGTKPAIGSKAETDDEDPIADAHADALSVSMCEPVKLNERITITVNSAKLFSSFEETGYSPDGEYMVPIDDLDSEIYKDCEYLLVDFTFLYTDDSLSGQLIKDEEKLVGINGMIEPFCSDTGRRSGTWERFPSSEIVFDYDVVKNSNRYKNPKLSFDVIEGQEFHFKVVYAVPKNRVASPLYLCMSSILSSGFQKYYVDLKLPLEDL